MWHKTRIRTRTEQQQQQQKTKNREAQLADETRAQIELNIPVNRSIIFYLENKKALQRKQLLLLRKKNEAMNSMKLKPINNSIFVM